MNQENVYFETEHGKVRSRWTENNASYSYYLGRKFIGVNNPDRHGYGPTKEEAIELAFWSTKLA
jgi:hypothetical protein